MCFQGGELNLVPYFFTFMKQRSIFLGIIHRREGIDITILATNDNIIVGRCYATYNIKKELVSIGHLMVNKEYRDHGFGQAMLKSLFNWVRNTLISSNSLQYLRLEAHFSSSNEVALHLAEKYGFYERYGVYFKDRPSYYYALTGYKRPRNYGRILYDSTTHFYYILSDNDLIYRIENYILDIYNDKGEMEKVSFIDVIENLQWDRISIPISPEEMQEITENYVKAFIDVLQYSITVVKNIYPQCHKILVTTGERSKFFADETYKEILKPLGFKYKRMDDFGGFLKEI